jgi:YegS/Rv2252/BmrU family lipid kinase
MKPHAIAIVNAAAGAAGEASAESRLSTLLKELELHWEIWPARGGGELAAMAQTAAVSQAMAVVAGGGDGTVNTVASHLIGTDKILGVLPLGTLNHFAKDLHIPLDLAGAVANIGAGHTTRVDVGEVNGRFFLNNSSLGIYPRIVDRREAARKNGRNKWIALVSALLASLKRYAAFRVDISAAGRRLSRRTPILFIGNNEYRIEGSQFGARDHLDRGCLSLYVLHGNGAAGLLRFFSRALIGKAWRAKDFDALQARDIRVETRRKRRRVALDGEVYSLEMPLHYRIHPGVLPVFVPHEDPE